MASDTTLASSALAGDDCAGFAEPADILSRLTPDDLHPARLAGPHAWHPWGLTSAPPTDRHLRLILAAGTRRETADLLIERLERQLDRAPWPPDAVLTVHRRDSRLDCRDDDARRSLIEVTVAPDDADRRYAEVVTREGWPILGELAALNDRIRCINVGNPSRTDLADLASWVERKMSRPAVRQRLAPLRQLLDHQSRDHPDTTDRLRTILANRGVTATHPSRVLDYLSEQLVHHRGLRQGQR
jgi:hypothetical protein